jgi:SAM-dependent methyltransferase
VRDDRLRWNARYAAREQPDFAAHPLAVTALGHPDLPSGPVLELACGPSGSALLIAAAGRSVTAVDVSDVGLGQLAAEAARRGLTDLVALVNADLDTWADLDTGHPLAGGYALVLCTGFWSRDVFTFAAGLVAPGGLIAWEALTEAARRANPSLPPAWCLRAGEPGGLLPPGFTVLVQRDRDDGGKRQLLAAAPPARSGAGGLR